MSYATDGRCHNTEAGSFNHECGQPATWIGRKVNGFESGFCDQCKDHGRERTQFKSWRRIAAKTASMADWLAEQNARQPRREELFKLVADPDDWKAPIEAFVSHGHNIEPEEMVDAIVHFTGTEVQVIKDRGGYTVKSVGYREGPCGP